MEGVGGTLGHLALYTRVCGQVWGAVYLCWVLVTTSWALHLMVLGLGLCLLSYLRLPPPSPALAKEVLGPEPCGGGEGGEGEGALWEVAHRAAALDAPENSLEAVRLAAANGAKMVEFDVSFASCGTAVAFHDDTLDRLTGAVGLVASLTFTQLGKLDLATKHPLSAQFQGVRIPKVQDFVAECLRLEMKVIIDLKSWEMPEETVALVAGLYRDLPALRTRALVTSFFPHLLYRLRWSDPDIVVSLSTRPYFLSSSTYEGTDQGLRPRFTGITQAFARLCDWIFPWLLQNVLWWLVGLSAVLVHKAEVSRQYVLDWRRRGIRVMAWTVNSPLEKEVMREVMGVTVLTDTLERAARRR